MMRFHFHVKDGETILDEEGTELDGVEAAKREAVLSCGEMIRDITTRSDFWSGRPWVLWVTGSSDGTGTTFIKLEFSGYVISS